MAILETIPMDELSDNWDLINELALAYASSSTSF